MDILGLAIVFIVWLWLTYSLGKVWKSKGKSVIDFWIMSWFICPFVVSLPLSMLWLYIFGCEVDGLTSKCGRGGNFTSQNLDLMLLFSTWGFWVTSVSSFWLYIILSIFKSPSKKIYSEKSK